MNKLIKVEKKKAQWQSRQKALQDQIWKLQQLIKEQHETIVYFKWMLDNATGLSTTHIHDPQPDIQTPTLQQSLEGTETNPVLTSRELENLVEPVHQAQENT
jgi:hypothetical protein